MNIKKYLREMAEKDAERLLTEADKEFCMKLAQETVSRYAQEQAEKERLKQEKKEKTKEIKKKEKQIIINL